MKPKVSILTTTYNHEMYIKQSVESVMTQKTDFDFQMVIGEDYSEDKTREILMELKQKYPDRINLLLREKNWGRRRNFVDVFTHCDGEYLAILEGDDYWTDPGKLQMQVDLLDNHRELALCFHPVMKVFETDGKKVKFHPKENKTVFILNDILRNNFIATCSVMYRNQYVQSFPDWFQHVPAGDWPLHVLHALHGDIGCINKYMGVHRIHSGGSWSPKSAQVRLKAKLEILSTFLKVLPEEQRSVVRTSILITNLKLGYSQLRQIFGR